MIRRPFWGLLALALLLPDRGEGQVCPDTATIIATGGAPHHVLRPDGTVHSSHTTEHAAHASASRLSSTLGVQVRVVRQAEWRVCAPPPGAVRWDTVYVTVVDTVPAPCECDSIPTPEPEPEPGPEPEPQDPSNPWPNEPAGFRVVTDNPFASRNHTGWQPNNRRATVTIESDPTAPYSGSTVLQANFPAGFPDGHEPGVDYLPLGGLREAYIGYYVRSNPEWQVNPFPDSYAGVKSTFLWFQNGLLFMGWGQWSGLSSLEPVIQGSGARTFETTTGVHRTANYVRPGQWHRVEIYFRTNDTGQQNGILRWWVNGQLIGSYTNAVFPGPGAQAFSIDNTLGGGGANKSRNDWIRYAHVRISRP